MRKGLSVLVTFLFLVFTHFEIEATTQSLQDRLVRARVGDFIVTEQDKHYSLLFVRSLTQESIVLEEVSISQAKLNLKQIDWQGWLKQKAPGHTSWTLLEIDCKTGALIECFSYSKMGWLVLDEQEQFLTRLLTLPLSPVPKTARKKIGPPPSGGELDRRSIWNPPLVVEGKKRAKPSFEVWQTKWPADGTLLSLCTLQLYFSAENPAFPFPYWLEVQSPHYTFKMRTIDSGHGLTSPYKGEIPRRTPLL